MHREPPLTHLGVGLYSAPEAARIIGVAASKVEHWLRDGQLLHRYFSTSEETITFVELMQLQFIHLFHAAGVSLKTIRTVASLASDRFESDHPFSVKRFDTEVRTVFDELTKANDDEQPAVDLQKAQTVF